LLFFTIGEYFLFHFTSNFSRCGVENLLFLYCTMMQQFFILLFFLKICFNILINISNFVLKSINKNLRSYLVYYKSLSNHQSTNLTIKQTLYFCMYVLNYIEHISSIKKGKRKKRKHDSIYIAHKLTFRVYLSNSQTKNWKPSYNCHPPTSNQWH
jgi:hypothetical protein